MRSLRSIVSTASRIAAYKALTPAERAEVDDDRLCGFIIRCNLPRADAHDAIENRMTFLSEADKEQIYATLQSHYTRH